MKVLLGLLLIAFGVVLFAWGVGELLRLQRLHRERKAPLPVVPTVPEDATDEWKRYIPPPRDEMVQPFEADPE